MHELFLCNADSLADNDAYLSISHTQTSLWSMKYIRKSTSVSTKGNHTLGFSGIGFFQKEFESFPVVITHRNPIWPQTPPWSDQTPQLIQTLMTWPKDKGNSNQHCLILEQNTSSKLLRSCPSKEFGEANKVASQNFMVTLCPKATGTMTLIVKIEKK